LERPLSDIFKKHSRLLKAISRNGSEEDNGRKALDHLKITSVRSRHNFDRPIDSLVKKLCQVRK